MSGKISKIYYLFVFVILVSVFYLIINGAFRFASKSNINIDPNALAGIEIGNYPWPPEIIDLEKRLSQIGLPALQQEGTILHTHQHLDIYLNGQKVTLPANVGIDDAKGFISPIHTHDDTGMIHVESPVAESFYLGQFFDIWGVRFTKDCLGGYCNNSNQKLEVFVDGNLSKGDPRTIELQSHQEIAVIYGNNKQFPSPIPESYAFPSGY